MGAGRSPPCVAATVKFMLNRAWIIGVTDIIRDLHGAVTRSACVPFNWGRPETNGDSSWTMLRLGLFKVLPAHRNLDHAPAWPAKPA
jgi:hypothetical protein